MVPRAPKITPKWSPKWRHGINGRPLRNMRRHRRIACPPPSGSSIFAHISKMQNIAPQITHKTQQSKKRAPKGSQKGLLFPVKNRKNPTCFRPWPSLGSRWGLEVPNITKMTSRTLPGSLISDQQRVEKGQDFPPGSLIFDPPFFLTICCTIGRQSKFLGATLYPPLLLVVPGHPQAPPTRIK